MRAAHWRILIGVLLLLPLLLVRPTEAEAAIRVTGSLTVSPDRHVPGQAVLFEGQLPLNSRQPIIIESNMLRTGDVWRQEYEFSGFTDSRGRFSFRYPAPSMFNIAYRVRSGNVATPPYVFYAKPQDVSLSINGSDPKGQGARVSPGLPYEVLVDTAPNLYPGQGLEPPVLEDREVKLQERLDGEWQTVSKGVADSDGLVQFYRIAGYSGETALRVRMEDWTDNGSQVGWTTSFPAYVGFGSLPSPLRSYSQQVEIDQRSRTGFQNSPNAGQARGWGATYYDYAWELGQSLSSPASRGTHRRGGWTAYDDGTGRTTVRNGALQLKSKRDNHGLGDLGSVSVQAKKQGLSQGRWEFLIWQNGYERGGRDYELLLELVPAAAPYRYCAPSAVRLAKTVVGSNKFEVGVRSEAKNKAWARTVRADIGDTHSNFAVEVTPTSITWFLNAKPVGRVNNNVLRGKSLVPRMTIRGGKEEMNSVQVSADWVRAWELRGGKTSAAAPSLVKTNPDESC